MCVLRRARVPIAGGRSNKHGISGSQYTMSHIGDPSWGPQNLGTAGSFTGDSFPSTMRSRVKYGRQRLHRL
eukprot:1194708-Prorocentrum_minimum.AAC.10